MEVVLLDEAKAEFKDLPVRERVAMLNAFAKLESCRENEYLGFPHSSNVQGERELREIRPRSGRSPYRAFYRRIGNRWVVGAIGPESETNQRGFRRAVAEAKDRLALFVPGII